MCGAVVRRLVAVGDVRVTVVVLRSCLMSHEGSVMPLRTEVQLAMACMSVSAGVRLEFVMALC